MSYKCANKECNNEFEYVDTAYCCEECKDKAWRKTENTVRPRKYRLSDGTAQALFKRLAEESKALKEERIKNFGGDPNNDIYSEAIRVFSEPLVGTGQFDNSLPLFHN